MINDFDLIVLRIVCACDGLSVVKFHAIAQKVCHSDDILWLNLYLYMKWLDEKYFDQVAKLVPYLLRKPFFKGWRLRLCFWRRSGGTWLGSSGCCCSGRC